ncbi:toxin-antitoxin system, toxin component, RelE family [delta proteobacterium NaphS2]|nr:toxin-antitoxin system, toxin component, RelE family [delta proteobacterium NaphS2]
MIYEVKIRKNALRGLEKIPLNVHKLLFLLIEDLKADEPIQKGWHNFSSLGN